MIIIERISSGMVDTNGYLIGDPDSGRGIFIDAPQNGSEAMLQLAANRRFTITHIVNTHGHWDHIADNAALRKATGAKVVIHANDSHYLLNPTALLFQLPFTIEPLVPDGYLADNQILEIGELKFSVIHTPGHTPGSICLYAPGEKILFSGDTLFAGSIGRTDLPGGDWDTLLKSINNRLFTLPDSVIIHPGHGFSSTIGDERTHNPFFV